MKAKKKVLVCCNIAVILLIVALIVAVIFLAIRKQKADLQDYYQMKCYSYSVQNTNLAKGQIVFIGDSITDLYVLDEHYGSLQRACYNRGIGGDTTAGVLERLQVSVFDLAPSTVVLMIGTNDVNGSQSQADILNRYEQIIRKIKATLPDVNLYCVSVIPQNKQLETYSTIDVDHTTQVILQLNPQIQQLAESNGAVYVDLFPLLADSENFLLPEYSDDGIHLNKNGLDVWTAQLLPLLQAEEASIE